MKNTVLKKLIMIFLISITTLTITNVTTNDVEAKNCITRTQRDSRKRIIRRTTCFRNRKIRRTVSYRYSGKSKVARQITTKDYYSSGRLKSNKVVRRNKNNKITYQKTTTYRNRRNKRTRRITIYSNYRNGVWRKREVRTYNNNARLTSRVITTRYNNKRTKSVTTYSQYSKGAWKRRVVQTYRTNRKRNRRTITTRYANNKNKQINTYSYNRQGQLRSNRNGNAYLQIRKYYTNGRISSNAKYQYDSKGNRKRTSYKTYNNPASTNKNGDQHGLYVTGDYRNYRMLIGQTRIAPFRIKQSGNTTIVRFNYDVWEYTDSLGEYHLEINPKTWVDVNINQFKNKLYDYDSVVQKEFLRLLNNERRSKGLNEVKLDSKLIESANIRAKEIWTLYSHTRPDGSNWSTVNQQVGSDAWGECIGGDLVLTGKEKFESWKASPGHNAIMMDSWNKKIGIGYSYIPEKSNYKAVLLVSANY